ncbi:hypothetical protein QRD02_07990 [Aequorivita sp. SDUM287046]|uniref:DUF1735 domain-containing protein n=1 Tax=Aequorivita aurantiaca TaxID=3053356 RepID=A0ABT8DG22_9FLAO|nr:hypothetical protein [Aequorivita aurantiaca]MDN3724321.1 hypothetical protein [Aequorivita aurantiaca]
MNTKFSLSILMACACLFFTACIKDTDFDQAEQIALTPIVELDLIYFDIQANRFFDSINSTPVLTVRDTTEIKFLDDGTLQESLKRAEFYFKFTNSIPRDFLVNFQFLSEANDTTYATGTPVAQGSLAAPVVTEFVENVEGENILLLTQAHKVVVSVSIPSSDETLEGNLNLKSKTTYFLEY